MANPHRMFVLLLWLALPIAGLHAQGPSPQIYDVVWQTPSEDASGSMPLGNGDIGVNAWVTPDGTLSFYISKTDCWSENGRLLKVGRVHITMDPPLDPYADFSQRLSLKNGAMFVQAGSGADQVVVELWVDANQEAIHVLIESESERSATAEIDLWRTERTLYPLAEVSDLMEDRSQPNKLYHDVYVEPDTVLEGRPNRIGWYHYNQKSVGPAFTAELQGLTEFLEDQTDPLLHRIFGALIVNKQGVRVDDHHLLSPNSKQHRFDIWVSTEHPSTPEQWLANIEKRAIEFSEMEFLPWHNLHKMWWEYFWKRSWINITQTKSSFQMPHNEHPVRIGEDQGGGNRFRGEIERMTILPFMQKAQPTIGAIADSSEWIFPNGFTVEAWIRPGKQGAGGGRIVDKTTPGGADGWLFDTYPGNSLRFIVGNRQLSVPDILPVDTRVHVAAKVDPQNSAMTIWMNGVKVAESDPNQHSDAFTVAQAYALQRWVDACAGRGKFPIKFNGSIFTTPHEGKFGDADYRRWGPGYWWQNTRLPYLSMCASGDAEMMRPLFKMYAEDLMPLLKARTQKYMGHEGAFLPECLYFWGPVFTATYGKVPFAERGADKLQDSRWHKWEWVSGLELVWMMLDYVEHTGDIEFSQEVMIPAAHEFLAFFEQHYPVSQGGKLVMDPSQSLETWWDCTNPMPEVAGLRAVTQRLLALPRKLGKSSEHEFWQQILDITPEIPTWEKDGVTLLAPAERFEAKSNVENPELYAVFPFRLVSFEKDNRELGLRTFENRWDRGSSGWRQEELFLTYLGEGEQAAASLVKRARNKHAGSRFPAFWGPNYDWIPDQDHGGILMRSLQTMLMQTEGRQIYLLPAWPENWNASFKLHAPYKTTISGRVVDGKIIDLVVEPEYRRADINLPQ